MRITVKDMVLWGPRTYVQGTHQIYAAMEVFSTLQLGRVQELNAKFRSRLVNNARFVLFEEGESPEKGWCTKIRIGSEAGVYSLFIYPDSEEVREHVPDDEAELVAGGSVSVEAGTFDMRGYNPQRILTVLTASNKVLLNSLFPRKGFGPWLLAQLTVRWPFRGQVLSLKLERCIGNCIASSSVQIDGVPFGEIQFVREAQ